MIKYIKIIVSIIATVTMLLLISSYVIWNHKNVNQSYQNSDSSEIVFQKIVDSTYETVFSYNELEYKEQKLVDSLDFYQTLDSLNKKNVINKTDSCIIRILEFGKNKKTESSRLLNNWFNERIDLEIDAKYFREKIGELGDSLKKIENSLKLKKGEFDSVLKKIEIAGDTLIGKGSIFFKKNRCMFFIAKKGKHKVQININKKGPYTFEEYYKFLSEKKIGDPLMITNGGMFKPGFGAQGLLVSNNEKISELDTSLINKPVNFYLFPNGVFFIDSLGNFNVAQTSKYKNEYLYKKKIPEFATQSGPMLVVDGKINPRITVHSENLNIRSGVGAMGNDKVVFIISSGKINFYDFALIFKDYFHCKNALYLDGAISEMYFKGDEEKPKGDFGPMISVIEK